MAPSRLRHTGRGAQKVTPARTDKKRGTALCSAV